MVIENPNVALSILDQAAAKAPLPREAHATVLQAIEFLAKFINPPKEADNKNVTPA